MYAVLAPLVINKMTLERTPEILRSVGMITVIEFMRTETHAMLMNAYLAKIQHFKICRPATITDYFLNNLSIKFTSKNAMHHRPPMRVKLSYVNFVAKRKCYKAYNKSDRTNGQGFENVPLAVILTKFLITSVIRKNVTLPNETGTVALA